MKTPLHNGLLQNDIDFGQYKPLNADLSGYAGTGVSWNATTKKFEATGAADANTVTGADIGLVGDGVTDNTDALQTWLNDVETAKVNATLIVDDGEYIFSGPLQDTGSRNAQILLPGLPSGERCYSVTIKGRHPIGNALTAVPIDMTVPQGAIFKTTLATGSGTQPSFMEGRAAGGLYDEVTTITLNIENMIFETVANPEISVLNLQRVALVNLLGDVLIISGNTPTEPTTPTSYAAILSNVNTTMLQRVDNLQIYNFYNGLKVSELAHITNVVCANCYYAMEFGTTYHSNLVERLMDWECKNGIKVTGTTSFRIQQHDVERAPGSLWYTRNYDIDDVGNLATGDVSWWEVTANVGAENLYTVNGGSGLKIRRQGGTY